MALDASVVRRFHKVLVEEIRRGAPEYLKGPFTVAEIYQSLVPYRTHRDRIGVELNGDYEAALLRLLSGTDGFLELESDAARSRIQRELDSSNPNTGLYREFAAVQVRLNEDSVPEADDAPPEGSKAKTPSPESREPAGTPEASGAGTGSGKAPSTSVATRKDAPARNRTRGSGKPSPDSSAPRRARGTPPSECPDCDSSLPERDTLRFCPFCGTNVFIMPCEDCGEVLERDWGFCIACGTPTDG